MALLRGHWQLLALTAAIFALWQTPVVLPLKIFVVFLHEVAHGLAAVLTGGEILEIGLSIDQGGHAITRGGNAFVVLSAGYLGSLVLGLALLLLALHSRADRLALAGVGGVLVLVAVLYVRDGFALGFCLATGAVCLAVARWLGPGASDFLLRVLGLTSLIYVPYDIFSDTIARSTLRSDAYMLAERVGGSAALWGGLWLAISLAVIALAVRGTLRAPSNLGR